MDNVTEAATLRADFLEHLQGLQPLPRPVCKTVKVQQVSLSFSAVRKALQR